MEGDGHWNYNQVADQDRGFDGDCGCDGKLNWQCDLGQYRDYDQTWDGNWDSDINQDGNQI